MASRRGWCSCRSTPAESSTPDGLCQHPDLQRAARRRPKGKKGAVEYVVWGHSGCMCKGSGWGDVRGAPARGMGAHVCGVIEHRRCMHGCRMGHLGLAHPVHRWGGAGTERRGVPVRGPARRCGNQAGIGSNVLSHRPVSPGTGPSNPAAPRGLPTCVCLACCAGGTGHSVCGVLVPRERHGNDIHKAGWTGDAWPRTAPRRGGGGQTKGGGLLLC